MTLNQEQVERLVRGLVRPSAAKLLAEAPGRLGISIGRTEARRIAKLFKPNDDEDTVRRRLHLRADTADLLAEMASHLSVTKSEALELALHNLLKQLFAGQASLIRRKLPPEMVAVYRKALGAGR